MPELELFGVVFALKHCKYYTLVAEGFEIRCDHAPLKGFSEKDLSDLDNPRLVRMFESILNYDCIISHVKGHQNQVADCLSRKYLGESEIEDFQVDLHDLPNR